ncbi:hypothetical protein [Ferrovum sp.]|uniref:hypothetical protein n=1 Tax=Ferrovum sp. TaxID=2609467 RepID=UPI002625FB71|nr:hypothetical protein [Ferrovum sp.]
MTNNSGYQGTLTELVGRGEFNQLSFVVQQIMNRANHATLVQVVGVVPGGVGPVGTVNVTPLVNMVDGNGNAIPHGVIYTLPYLRLQGAQNAIIIDPQVNDIGLCVFADQDISTVKSTLAAAIPATHRRNDWADGLYIGGMLNGTPTQYLEFSSTGINVVTPGDLVMTVTGNLTANVTGTAAITAPTVDINASSAANVTTPTMTVNGNLTVTGTVTA